MSKQTFVFVLISILIMYYLYYLRNQFIEGFTEESNNNYIENGLFLNTKAITNSDGETEGHQIIKMQNPSESPYVLKQTSDIEGVIKNNYYVINVNLNNSKKYRISLWENLTNEYDGKTGLFTINIKMVEGNDTIFTSKGDIILSETVMGNVWYRKEHIFTLPEKSTGSVTILIGDGNLNNKGFRYFTDVQLEDYYQTLKIFPIKKGLLTYISMFNIDNINSLNTLKDLTGNGYNFISDKTINIKNSAISLTSISLKGPPSDSYGFNNNFTIGFSLSGITSTKLEVLKMFSSNIYKHGLEIIINKVNISDNYITINFKNNVYYWKLGLIENYNNYFITYVDNAFRFYINGILISPESEKINKQLPKVEEEKKQPDITTETFYAGNAFLINAPCYINMDGKGIGYLYAFYMFNYELSFSDINKIDSYLNLEYYKNKDKNTFNKMVKDVRKIKDNPIIINNNNNQPIDMSKYILKDEIPCWGCNLK